MRWHRPCWPNILIPLLPKDQRAVFAALSARVGSIGDNRLGGWYSYRGQQGGVKYATALYRY